MTSAASTKQAASPAKPSSHGPRSGLDGYLPNESASGIKPEAAVADATAAAAEATAAALQP